MQQRFQNAARRVLVQLSGTIVISYDPSRPIARVTGQEGSKFGAFAKDVLGVELPDREYED